MATKGMAVFRANGEDYTINDPNNANEFDSTRNYAIGDRVYYQGQLWSFVLNHPAGAWNEDHVVEELLGQQMRFTQNGISDFVYGGSQNYHVKANEIQWIRYPFMIGETYIITNNTSATCGNVRLFRPDGTIKAFGYIAAGASLKIVPGEYFDLLCLYPNAAGYFTVTFPSITEEAVRQRINGATIISKEFTVDEQYRLDHFFMAWNKIAIINESDRPTGNITLIRLDGTTRTYGYVQPGTSMVINPEEDFVAINIYSNGTGRITIKDCGFFGRMQNTLNTCLVGGTFYEKNFTNDESYIVPYLFIPGNTYTIINQTGARLGNALLYRTDGTSISKGYVNTGTTNFTVDEEFIGISLYSNGSGKITLKDGGFAARVDNGGAAGSIEDMNRATSGAVEASVIRDEMYPYVKKIYPQMLVCTDIHTDWVRLERAFRYNESNENSDMTLCTGDIVEFPRDLNSYDWGSKVLALTKPVLPIIGNHDACVIESGKQTNAQLYEKFFSSALQTHNGETHNSSSLYWYKDIVKTYTDAGGEHTKVLRVIGLNQFEYPDDTSNNRSCIWYSQEQITWLANLLESTSSGTYVLIATHEPPTKNGEYKSSPWTINSKVGVRIGLDFDDGGSQGDPDMLIKIIKAWVAGTSVSISNTQSLGGQTATITLSKTFTAHTGQFAGWICGHAHKDGFLLPDEDENQKIIMFHCTTAAQGQQSGDLGRSENGKAQDCVTLVSYDWDKDKIRLVRLGADVTSSGALRQMVVI